MSMSRAPGARRAVPEMQVVDRARGAVHLLEVAVREEAVAAGHLEAGVAQQLLQGEGVALVLEEGQRRGVADGVGRAAYAGDAGARGIFLDDGVEAVLGEAAPVEGEEQEIVEGVGGNRAVHLDITPQTPLHLAPDGHRALPVALAQDLDAPLVYIDVPELHAGDLAAAGGGVEHDQEQAEVAVPLRGGGVHRPEKPVQVARAVGFNDPLPEPGQFQAEERRILYKAF